MKKLLFSLILLILFAVVIVPAFAQAPAKPAPPATPLAKTDAPTLADKFSMTSELPALSEVEKLKVQNVLLRIELAQRAAQQAQSDFDKARTEATALIQGLQKPGYDLDLQALVYKAAPKEDPKPPAPVKK